MPERAGGMPPARVFSRIGFAFALAIVIQYLLVAVIATAVRAAAPALMESGWFLWVLNYLPLYLVAMPVMLLVLRGVPSHSGRPEKRVRVSPGQLLVLVVACFGVTVLLQYGVTLVSELIRMLRGRGVENPLETIVSGSDPLMNLIFACVVAPVMEELIFRGLLYRKLIAFGGKVYVLFSAFIFALFHTNLYQVPYAFAVGLVLAGLTYFTGTIRYAVLVHMTINLLGSGIFSLLAYVGEEAQYYYGSVQAVIALVGIVLAINMAMKWREERPLRFAPGAVAAPGARTILLNAGVLCYAVIVAFLMVKGVWQ